MSSAYQDTVTATTAEIRKYTTKVDATAEAVAYIEVNAFLCKNPGFYACETNKDTLLNWLAARDLPITVPNLERGFKELAENAQLYFSEPPPTQRNYTPPKRAPYKWTSSSFDKGAVDELKANLARWNGAEVKEFLALNHWSDFPTWLTY